MSNQLTWSANGQEQELTSYSADERETYGRIFDAKWQPLLFIMREIDDGSRAYV